MNPQQVAELIQRGLPGSRATVASEDNVHFEAVVIAAAFAGKRPLQRHQLVYATLGAQWARRSTRSRCKVFTPDEYASQASGRG